MAFAALSPGTLRGGAHQMTSAQQGVPAIGNPDQPVAPASVSPDVKDRSPFAHTSRVFVGVTGALVLLLLIMNWVVTPLIFPKTTDAWMNAPLTTIRAESEGNLHILRQVGEMVPKGG